MEEACLSGSSMFSTLAISSNRIGEHENAQIERHDTNEQQEWKKKEIHKAERRSIC